MISHMDGERAHWLGGSTALEEGFQSLTVAQPKDRIFASGVDSSRIFHS